MSTLYEQLTLAIKNTSLNITPNTDWTVEEYHEFMAYVNAGWLLQDCGKWFEINPDWDNPPMWTPDLEEEEQNCVKCNIFLTEDDLRGKTGEQCEECELEHKEKMTDSLGYIKYDMEGAQDGEYIAGEEEEDAGLLSWVPHPDPDVGVIENGVWRYKREDEHKE